MELFKSLENRIKLFKDPFKHFEINEPLTQSAVDEICNAEIADPRKQNLNYDGTRALDGGEGAFRAGIKDGGKAKKLRCYVNKENSNQFPNLTKFIEELRSPEVYKKIGSLIGKDLSNSYVRLEVICDREGFWLKPHCDIEEKLISCKEVTLISLDFRDFIPSRQTLAVDILVQYGTLFARVALLKANASLNCVSLFPPPVFITKAIFLVLRTSTI